MSRARTLIVAACVGLSVAAPARRARADGAADIAAARELFNEASRLAAAGKWEEARERYQRSLGLKRAAITMYSLGVAQKNTGKLVEADENFRAFLAEPQTPATKPYDAPARQAIGEITPRLAKVAIAIQPADAPELVVTIDGERVPNVLLDRPRVVNPGAHDVLARAKGYADASQRVEVKDGGSGAVKLVLTPRPADAAAPAPIAPAPPPLAPRADIVPVLAAPPNRTVPVGLMIGGGAVFVGGVVIGMLGVAQAGSAPTRNGDDASAARTKSAIGDVVAGVGLAAAATGLVILITQHRPPAPDKAASAMRHE